MIKKETSFIDLKQVKIDDPFFSRVQNVVIHTMLPYQERVLHDEVSGIRKSHVIKNFRIAAGDEKGTYYGRVFQDSDLAKWLEAVAWSLCQKPDAGLEKTADEVIELVAAVLTDRRGKSRAGGACRCDHRPDRAGAAAGRLPGYLFYCGGAGT